MRDIQLAVQDMLRLEVIGRIELAEICLQGNRGSVGRHGRHAEKFRLREGRNYGVVLIRWVVGRRKWRKQKQLLI